MKSKEKDNVDGDWETAGVVSSTECTGMMAAQITDPQQAENLKQIYDINRPKAPKPGKKGK